MVTVKKKNVKINIQWLIALLFLGVVNVQAQQDAASQSLEKVVVTGIRKSLDSAVSLKRENRGLVDGIVAEDIGKFPDTNLAESMQRIAGVSIDRNASGEGSRVTVRGVGPDFNMVLLNGRQMPTSAINQLNGKTVATTTGTTSVQTLRKHERASGVDFKEVFGKDHADSFLLLDSGRADAFVMDGSILAKNIATSKNPADFRIVGEVLSVEPIAIMMRKDDPAFKKAVDDSIKGMMKSGELAKLYDKWFLQPIPPTNTKIGLPLSAATKDAWANPNDKPMEDYAKK